MPLRCCGGRARPLTRCCRRVGEYLHRYKSGRVPKAFKVTPVPRHAARRACCCTLGARRAAFWALSPVHGAPLPRPVHRSAPSAYSLLHCCCCCCVRACVRACAQIVPSLKNWEEILFITNPERWTPAATFVATRIFASNFNPKMAQR